MRAEFARRVSLTLVTRVAGIAIGIVTLTMTTRILGPAGRGVFAVCMATVALVIQLSNCGLHAAGTHWLAREPARRQSVVNLLLWFSFAPVAILCVAIGGLLRWQPNLIRDVPFHTMALALAAAPASMFLLLASNAALGLGRTSLFNLLDLVTKVIGLASVLVLLWTGIDGVFAAYALLHLVAAGIAYAWLSDSTRPNWPERELLREMFGYGARIFLVGLCMFLVLRLDLFLVNAMLTTADAGQYSVAVQVGDVLTLGSASISAILFPTLSGMAPERRWPTTVRVVRVTGCLLGGGAVALALVARPLFTAWFGPTYDPAVTALWWLLPGLWCLGVNSLLHQHLAAFGMPWFLVWSTGAGAVVNGVTNVVLLPRFGINGAAIASTATYGALLCATTLFLGTRHGRAYLG